MKRHLLKDVEIEIENYHVKENHLYVAYMNEQNAYEQKYIPLNDLKNFVIAQGWLRGNVVYDQSKNDTKEYPDISFEEFIHHILNQNHLKKYLTQHGK